MANYAVGTDVVFTQTFKDAQNNPLVPLDLTNYPAIQVEDPNGAVAASGVASSTQTPGVWTWTWSVPTSATIASGWKVVWALTDVSGSSVSRSVEFTLTDQTVSPDGFDRTGGYLVMKPNIEMLLWQNELEPADLTVSFQDPSGVVLFTRDKTNALMTHVVENGFHTYKTPTAQLTLEGQYTVLWSYRLANKAIRSTDIQWLVVPYDSVWQILPHFRGFIDKLRRSTTTPLSYLDIELWQALHLGLGFLNSVHPMTDWNEVSLPTSLSGWWIIAAGLWALESRQLCEIEVSHSFSGQTVSLEYDHAGPLSEVLQRWQMLLWEKFAPQKLSIYRAAAGPGLVGVRPYRLDMRQFPFRVRTSGTGILNLSGLIGMLQL